jgi:hypothetical protein
VRSHYLILLTADESLFQLREAHALRKHNSDESNDGREPAPGADCNLEAGTYIYFGASEQGLRGGGQYSFMDVTESSFPKYLLLFTFILPSVGCASLKSSTSGGTPPPNRLRKK